MVQKKKCITVNFKFYDKKSWIKLATDCPWRKLKQALPDDFCKAVEHTTNPECKEENCAIFYMMGKVMSCVGKVR